MAMMRIRQPNTFPKSNCPYCSHSAQYHLIIHEMGMTVCRVRGCKCALTYGYTEKLIEEMR